MGKIKSVIIEAHTGYVKGSETSEHAARLVQSKAGAMRSKVIELIKSRGNYGCTSYEASKALGMKTQTVSARFSELSQFGWIIKTNKKRTTQGNYKAAVYVIKDLAHLVTKNAAPTLLRLEKIDKTIAKLEREKKFLLEQLND
jgi:predicted transcriptional regulator